jgi:hypothetical protein
MLIESKELLNIFNYKKALLNIKNQRRLKHAFIGNKGVISQGKSIR